MLTPGLSPSEPEFWRERWSEGRIGFHEGRANAYLVKHGDRLAGATRVLVPLCGKAEDLAYLASRGHAVVGIEVVESAVRAFFDEHGLAPTIVPRGAVTEYRAGAITIYAGDVFAVTAELAGPFDALYDRAALIALPADVRQRYVPHLRTLLAPGARALVITFEFPDGTRTPPPHSVSGAEVRALYAGAAVEEIDHGSDPRAPDDATLTERCFAIALPRG